MIPCRVPLVFSHILSIIYFQFLVNNGAKKRCHSKPVSTLFLAIFSHLNYIVERKCILGVTIGIYVDSSFLLPFTCLIQYLRKNFMNKGPGWVLLGPIILILWRKLLQRRNNRDRLNFINVFISVCVNLPPWKYFLLLWYIYRLIFQIIYAYNVFYQILFS